MRHQQKQERAGTKRGDHQSQALAKQFWRELKDIAGSNILVPVYTYVNILVHVLLYTENSPRRVSIDEALLHMIVTETPQTSQELSSLTNGIT